MPDKKKKKLKVLVDKKLVNDLLDEIQRKVLSLKHGYIANDELDEIRELVK